MMLQLQSFLNTRYSTRYGTTWFQSRKINWESICFNLRQTRSTTFLNALLVLDFWWWLTFCLSAMNLDWGLLASSMQKLTRSEQSSMSTGQIWWLEIPRLSYAQQTQRKSDTSHRLSATLCSLSIADPPQTASLKASRWRGRKSCCPCLSTPVNSIVCPRYRWPFARLCAEWWLYSAANQSGPSCATSFA